ncbi:hypothetical protein [Brevundimonas vesicularis]|uniref:hypothetical protein n=1 Tax=Brevundimonas vesicularis TaxID=41276 RepID=UPI0038D49B56
MAVTEVRITKAELDAAPEAERIHFLMLAQTANEMAMLRVLIIQSLNGAKGQRPTIEAGLGMAFMLARLLSGRVHEAWDLVSKESIGQQFQVNLLAIPEPDREGIKADVDAANAEVRSYFGQAQPLLSRVRKKLAFHHDRSAMAGAYDLTPDNFQLMDFHSGKRGTTFYGAADRLAAFAASHLIGSADPIEGQHRLTQEAPRIGGEIETIIDGYIVAFCAKYLGLERFSAVSTTLRIPVGAEAKAVFFLDDRPLRYRVARQRADGPGS